MYKWTLKGLAKPKKKRVFAPYGKIQLATKTPVDASYYIVWQQVFINYIDAVSAQQLSLNIIKYVN